MKRCVIVGGADINNYEYIKNCLHNDDFVVFCDSGLKHLEYLQVTPGLIVGDFDSHKNPNLDVETIVLPCEKDDTDTVYAVKEAIKRGFDEFLLIGVIGGRLDHTLGNVSILLHLESLGKKGKIIDDYSEMEIVSKEPAFIDDSYAFFSLLNRLGESTRSDDVAIAVRLFIVGAKKTGNHAGVVFFCFEFKALVFVFVHG